MGAPGYRMQDRGWRTGTRQLAMLGWRTGRLMMTRTATNRTETRPVPLPVVGFDPGFIRRVMRTTAFVAIVLAGIVYPRFGERVTIGLLVGAALAIASLG